MLQQLTTAAAGEQCTNVCLTDIRTFVPLLCTTWAPGQPSSAVSNVIALLVHRVQRLCQHLSSDCMVALVHSCQLAVARQHHLFCTICTSFCNCLSFSVDCTLDHHKSTCELQLPFKRDCQLGVNEIPQELW